MALNLPCRQLPGILHLGLLPFFTVHYIKCGALPLQVEALIDAGVYDMETLAKEKWVTGLKYNDEVIDMLKERTRGKKDKVRSVRSAFCPAEADVHTCACGLYAHLQRMLPTPTCALSLPACVTRLPTCMLPMSADGLAHLHLARLRQLICLACGYGCLPKHRRTGMHAETGALCMQVGLKRYAKVSTSAFAGLMGGKAIAVVRAAGESGVYARPEACKSDRCMAMKQQAG